MTKAAVYTPKKLYQFSTIYRLFSTIDSVDHPFISNIPDGSLTFALL